MSDEFIPHAGHFKKGNAGGGRKKKVKDSDTIWSPKGGDSAQEVIDNNATDYISWCFAIAKEGDSKMREALLRKLMPDKAVKMGASQTMPDFAKDDMLDLMDTLDELDD